MNQLKSSGLFKSKHLPKLTILVIILFINVVRLTMSESHNEADSLLQAWNTFAQIQVPFPKHFLFSIVVF